MTSNLHALYDLAVRHAANARDDINFASTRVEHIRVSALAIQAEQLVNELKKLMDATGEEAA